MFSANTPGGSSAIEKIRRKLSFKRRRMADFLKVKRG
jgi:hypothetical protein